MKKSNCTTPRVFSLMRMMSHSKLLIEQFIHLSSEILLDDDVAILINVLFMDNVQSCITAPKLQEDGSGTKVISMNLCWLSLLADIPHTGAARVTSWSWHQNCKRRRWYKSDQHKFMSIKSICRYSSTWCRRENPGHGTRIARGFVRY